MTLWRVRVPLLRAHSTSYASEDDRDIVLVEWRTTDGISGWGECPTFTSPGYVTETTDEAWVALCDELASDALASSTQDGLWPHWPGDSTDGRRWVGLQASLGALRDAALDNRLRRSGVALLDHLGGTSRALRRTAVLAAVGDDLGALITSADAAFASGAELVKVKIAPGWDSEVLIPLVERFGARRLAADANGAYRRPAQLEAIDELGIAYLEQPFPHGVSWEEMAELNSSLVTPVALDESITSSADVSAVHRFRACRLISVKPAKVGGVQAAAAMLRLADELGIGAFVGGMVELGVGRASALAVASLGSDPLPTDLGPSAGYFSDDLTSGVDLDDDGLIRCPIGSGFGDAPIMESLERHVVDRAVIAS